MSGLNRRQYEAALIWLKIQELALIGGTDYRSVMLTTLIDDAVALTKTMNPNQRRIAMLNIAYNAAIQAGADYVAELDAEGLNDQTACCFQDYPDLESILILLECKLGRHADYPQ